LEESTFSGVVAKEKSCIVNARLSFVPAKEMALFEIPSRLEKALIS